MTERPETYPEENCKRCGLVLDAHNWQGKVPICRMNGAPLEAPKGPLFARESER